MENIGVAIDLILENDGKILLGKVAKKWRMPEGEWGLPGGDIEPGETFRKAVERNLRKELGMKLKTFEIVSVNSNFWLGNHYVNIGVRIDAEGEAKLNNAEDWEEWKWFGKDNLPKKMCEPAKLTIESFLNRKVSSCE